MKAFAQELMVCMKCYLRGSLTVDEYRRQIAEISVRHRQPPPGEPQAPGEPAMTITVRRGVEAS